MKTQIELARENMLTPQMERVAWDEGVPVELIRERVEPKGKSLLPIIPLVPCGRRWASVPVTADQGQRLHRYQLRYLRLGGRENKGGEWRTMLFSISPVTFMGEDCLSATMIDITARKRAEEELRLRENQLQKIFEILPIGLWFVDKDGTLLRGNPKGIEIWGAQPTVPISEYGVFKAWHLPSRKPVRADEWALAKTIRSGETIVDELLEIAAFDGKRKTILNYTAPVLDGEGQVDGAIVVNLDISERKALEDQLRQAQKMESVGRQAGGVAHDFNNMLGIILGHIEMALEETDPASPLHAGLQAVQHAAERSADLTRQLLAFARKQTVAPKVIDLNDTVEGMLKMLCRLIGEDIDLLWKPAKSLAPVKMDPSQIDQILVNLCINARDAIGGVGKITIETDVVLLDEVYCAMHAGFVPGEYVLLAVSDNGCGMDQKTISHLFEPFYTTKESGKGTGLGLASVYGAVKRTTALLTCTVSRARAPPSRSICRSTRPTHRFRLIR